MFHVVNFYKFAPIEDPDKFADELRELAEKFELIGTVLLAKEGVNAGLSGGEAQIIGFIKTLAATQYFSDVEFKLSTGVTKPYKTLRIKVKQWVVRLADDQDPNVTQIVKGKRISCDTFHEILCDEKPNDYTIVDTRNYYETDYGVFKNAVRLPIKNFTEFPAEFERRFGDKKDRKYVIYCTGGIRCEKAAPYLEKLGYEEVYQVDGGMLSYFEKFGSDGFEGQCFVFDRRWILDPSLTEGSESATDQNLRIQPKRNEWPNQER